MNRSLAFSRPGLLSSERKVCFIKDPVHGSVNFSREQTWLYLLVNTEEFCRLHGLRQIALSHWNFPSAQHTRFTHSLGVYELCNRFIRSFVENGYLDPKADGTAINVALAAALLHDIGHGPLSHALEAAVPGFRHEEMGIRIITSEETKVNRILRDKAMEDGLEEDFYCREVAAVLARRSRYRWVMELISSDFDVDRLDYLVRDSMHSGVQYGGHIDVDLFIKWAAIRNGELVFLKKIRNGLCHFATCRQLMYQDLYGNRVSNGLELLFARGVELIGRHMEECRSCLGFDRCRPLFAGGGSWTLEEFMRLNDAVVMMFMEEALAKLCRMEEARRLLGCLFGVWMDRNGRYCERRELEGEESREDREMRERQIYAKGVVDVMRVKLWDPNTDDTEVVILDKLNRLE